jgi:hypothetical protein
MRAFVTSFMSIEQAAGMMRAADGFSLILSSLFESRRKS